MIYIIKRASDHLFEKESPCEEAIKKPFANWDTRYCTEESYNNRFAKKYYLVHESPREIVFYFEQLKQFTNE